MPSKRTHCYHCGQETVHRWDVEDWPDTTCVICGRIHRHGPVMVSGTPEYEALRDEARKSNAWGLQNIRYKKGG